MGRVPDVRKLVTKDFKSAGNKLVLLGAVDPEKLGGSVYADAFGERGDALSDWGNEWAKELPIIYRKLHSLYWNGNPVKSASAIAEGGTFLRVFESAMGGGLGAKIDLSGFPAGRKDGALFGEAVGAILLEMEPSADPFEIFGGLPWKEIGQVTDSGSIEVVDGEQEVWSSPVDELVKIWEKPFAEVVR
jgi:phosphoribosylformylglycinamidine synthase